MDKEKKIPLWMTIAAIILLIWNLMGLSQFLMDPALGLSQMDIPAELAEIYAARPLYALFGFAMATIAGSLGALLLVIKRFRLAKLFFVLSVIGVIISNFWLLQHNELLNDAMRAGLILQGVVLLIALFWHGWLWSAKRKWRWRTKGFVTIF